MTQHRQTVGPEVMVLLDLEFGIVDIDPSDNLLSEGHLDSLTVVELVLLLEETFGMRIEDAQVTSANFSTVESIANLIAGIAR